MKIVCQMNNTHMMKSALPMFLEHCEECNQLSGVDFEFDIDEGVDPEEFSELYSFSQKYCFSHEYDVLLCTGPHHVLL